MPKIYDKEILQKAYDLITINKYSANKAAKELNIDCGTMRKRLKEYYDFEFLPDGKKKIDSTFFNQIDSEEKAYWLGFLTADGYVSGNGRIELGLAEIDKEHIEKFKKAIQSDHKISQRKTTAKNKEYLSYRICFTDQILTTSLIKYGLTSNKSYDATIPKEFISKDLMRHYIRGLFDGDGSLYSYFQANNKERYELSIVSGSKNMYIDLMSTIKDHINIDMKYRLSRNLHEVRLYNQSKIKHFLSWIYEDCNISLKRKHDKAIAVIG